MTGIKLIQAIGISGMDLSSNNYITFEFQDSKAIARVVAQSMLDEATGLADQARCRKLLEEVNAAKMGGQ